MHVFDKHADLSRFLLHQKNLRRQVSSNDIPRLQTQFESIVSEQQPFERLEMTKAELLEMFKVHSYWLSYIATWTV